MYCYDAGTLLLCHSGPSRNFNRDANNASHSLLRISLTRH